MRLYDLLEAKTSSVVARMSVEEKHGLAKFIHQWLSGNFMPAQTPDVVETWERLRELFPPKVGDSIRLFRLVTLPIDYASQKEFIVRPGPKRHPLSSWSSTLQGIDAVHGVAREFDEGSTTCRVAIKALIPGTAVVASTQSIRRAFMMLTHDYFDKYPSQIICTPMEDGMTSVQEIYPSYPGADDQTFTMDDIGFLHDVLMRKGGNYYQHEYVVETPDEIPVELVRIYRLGNDQLLSGDDDPHNGAGRSRRVKRF